VQNEGDERVGHALKGVWAKTGRAAGAAAAFAGVLVGVALAAQPEDRGIDLQPAATQVMQDVREFHIFMVWVMVGISAVVLALLLWVIVRYNRRANPTPKTFTHNVPVEIAWTVIPVLILVGIAWKSFPLLFEEERIPPAELTIKAIGNSWFWTYDYPDHGISQLTSSMLSDEEAAAAGRPRLLATDTPIVVPVGVNVRILVTSNDVIHSWAMPSFGVKEDAIPGRINEGWFNVREPGVYYGQCSELCGERHAFMPIEVRAVPMEEFNAWVVEQGGTAVSAQAPAAPSAG
jgi:cytochrome c oxidase subunit 2